LHESSCASWKKSSPQISQITQKWLNMLSF